MTDIDVWRTIRELQAAVNELRDGITEVREYIRQCEAAAEEGLSRFRAMTESSTQRHLTPVSGPPMRPTKSWQSNTTPRTKADRPADSPQGSNGGEREHRSAITATSPGQVKRFHA